MGKMLSQKILIFDLDGLRDIESKEFLTKSGRNIQNLKLLIAKIIHLMNLIKEILIML